MAEAPRGVGLLFDYEAQYEYSPNTVAPLRNEVEKVLSDAQVAQHD